MASTICFVRSGKTPWSAEGRLLGRRDLALSAEGKSQLSSLAGILGHEDWTEVLVSPMRRSIQTAEILSISSVSLAKDGRLGPVDVGALEGKNLTELADEPQWVDFREERSAAMPGGEPIDALIRRVASSIEQARADNPDDAKILCVSHQWPIAAAVAHYLDLPPKSLARFSIDHGAATVLRVDDITHQATLVALNWSSAKSYILNPG